MDNISMQAETLVNALPYIQKYRDKIIVVKYGGNAMLNEDLKKSRYERHSFAVARRR